MTAAVEYDEEVAEGAHIGVRVRLASGSDGSCESPLADEWLSIVGVSDGRGNRADAPDGEVELRLPAEAGRRRLTVELKEPIDDAQALELDLVRRRPSEPGGAAEAGSDQDPAGSVSP